MTDKQNSALKAMLNYQQADMDGVMVTVSRQAIHEVADQLAAAEARVKAADELINSIRVDAAMGVNFADEALSMVHHKAVEWAALKDKGGEDG